AQIQNRPQVSQWFQIFLMPVLVMQIGNEVKNMSIIPPLKEHCSFLQRRSFSRPLPNSWQSVFHTTRLYCGYGINVCVVYESCTELQYTRRQYVDSVLIQRRNNRQFLKCVAGQMYRLSLDFSKPRRITGLVWSFGVLAQIYCQSYRDQ